MTSTVLRTLSSTTVDRTELPIRIMQIGAGNFLRGFVDWMVHHANAAGVLRHGIAVVKVTTRAETVTPQLAAQDGLFHVVLDGLRDGAAVTDTTLVTAVQEVTDAYRDWDRCRELARSEDLRLVVSNTTEAGIVDADDDLTAAPPASFPAKVTVLLHERWQHLGGRPGTGLTFLPCELTEDNGSKLREIVLGHARRGGYDPAFGQWVTDECRFYDTIVDRIVPGLAEEEAAAVREAVGYDDRLIVRGELYGHWAIAGDPAIRAEFPLDRAGLPVEFLDDIRAYREQKVRILNGAHSAMAAIGPAFGCVTVREATEHPVVGAYLRALLDDEILPSLPGDPDALRRFAAAIVERFRNPALKHRLGDIALNALAKWHTRDLPVILDLWRSGRPAPRTVTSLAFLLAGYAGALDTAEVRDDAAVIARVREGFDPASPQPWLAALFPALGWDLAPAEAARLAAETAAALRALLAGDPAAALESATV